MNCILEHFQTELVIKHSRFIAEVFPVENQAAARELLKEQKQKYFDSTHVVHAFVIGKNAEILGMSDDGEPSGTAGRPVLDVLKGSGCTNIIYLGVGNGRVWAGSGSKSSPGLNRRVKK